MSTKRNDSWVLVGKDGRTHDLSHGMIFIGREECDIVLQAASADKRHAVLCYNNNEQKFHIKDLNSLTGTYVNGIRIEEQTYVKLKRLDCIRFGYGPDVFYLEKSSNATSPCIEYQDVPVKEESIEKNLCNDVRVSSANDTRISVKPNADVVEQLSVPHNSHTSDLPSMTREDPPPDTLPLNLSNTKQKQQKDWDWIGHDGTLSDSPDYSQKSETSSCSAPLNYGTNHEDRDTGSAQSSPAATAFTIAFESEAVTPRKKLGIRDSISKFAPTKTENDNRVSFQQKNCKSEPSPKKLPLSDAKSSIPKSRTQFPYPDLKDIEGLDKIKDSASFLIKKMLNGEMSPSDIPEDKPLKEKSPLQNLQNDTNDDHSEAGTYTVETEHTDCDVEEARKKIDEVFGVIQLSNSVLSSSYSSSTSSSAAKQIPRLNGRLKQSMLKNPLPKQRETSIHWNGVNKNYTRSKPTAAPSPAISNESLCRTETMPPHSLSRGRKPSDVPSTPDKIRRSKIAITPKSPGKPRAPSTLKSPGSLSNNLSAVSSSRESCHKDEPAPTCRRSADSRSEGSKSPHTSAQWQKVPWNLSGSDLDLDRSKSENNSILSDTSTEPSSHSSHSSKSRPDQGPQMRLNRAFALRRARLEAESSKRGKENRSSTSSTQKSMKKSAKLSGSASTLREESSVKMNFHLTPAITKPFPTRQMVQCSNPRSDPMKRKVEIKSGHRRIESDPGKSIPVWKTDLRTVGSSELEEKYEGKKVTVNQSFDDSRLQTFHRSISCSIVNETDVPKSNLYRGSTHRDFPASFIKSLEHSVMCGSQIVTSHNTDDYSSRNQNKEISALDALVISAIHQLSSKLWMNSKELLEKERKKCPKGSDTWLMIDEVLPQVPVSGTPEDGDFTKDLSSILKNLKRVEQGLEVLSSVLENHTPVPETNAEDKQSLPQNFFIVDM